MILFLKNLLFTVLIPGTVGVYIPLRLAGDWRAVSPRDWFLAAPLLLAGASIYFWCLWNFAVTGRGTPAPIDPPKKLIVRGPHKYVRNPMYLGVLSVVFGLGRALPLDRDPPLRSHCRAHVPSRRPRHRGAFAEAVVRRRVRGVLPIGSQMDAQPQISKLRDRTSCRRVTEAGVRVSSRSRSQRAGALSIWPIRPRRRAARITASTLALRRA